MTLAAFLSPPGFVALLVWSFLVASAVQVTVRLLLAYSLRPTLLATVALTLASLPVAAIYDALVGPGGSLAERLEWAPVPMALMALAGFATARWVLHIRRTRGQIAAAGMVGLLAPHLFALVPV